MKGVIFDLDGTLLDTLPDIKENINLMLDKFGHKRRNDSELRQFIGCGARNLVEKAVGETLSKQELDERLAYYNEIYTASKSAKTRLFDGVKEMLETLKKRGYKIAILTNKPQTTTDRVLKEHLSFFSFDKVVGQSGTVKCKPDKAATMRILEELGLTPEETFFVGDGETDVMTAINSGTKGVAVLWGYRDKDQLEDAGAKVFVNTTEELLSILV